MRMRWAAVCLLLVLLPQVSIAVTHPDDALAVRPLGHATGERAHLQERRIHS